MKLSALLAPLIDAKVDHELIRQQIIAYEDQQSDALERRRQADAERQARKRDREKSRDVTVRHSDRSLVSGDAPVEDKTSNLEIEPQQEERNALKREFAIFWAEYPNKVGKPKAEASWRSARRRAEPDAIMAGLRRYVATKPHDRAWLNPTTFLNQDRWGDQPAVVPLARGSPQARAPTAQEILRSRRQEMNSDDDRPPNQPRLIASR